MDISKIDIDFIGIFDSSYVNAESIFGVEPDAAPSKTQKKIRKWVEKIYITDGDYPKEVMQYIGKEVSDKDFIRFIKACHEQVELNTERKKQLIDEASADLNEDAKSAIWALLEHNPYSKFRRAGTDTQIDVELCAGYDRTLTFINASGVPECDIDWMSNVSLEKRDDEYILSGEVADFEQDLSAPFSIHFTDARVDITVFRADEPLIVRTPWEHLESIATDILNKHTYLSDKYLNDKEKELLPLIVEISKLAFWSYIPDEFRSADFSHLKSYITKFGYNELLPLIENLEQEFYNDKKKDRIVKKLESKLNTQKYEPLWRELYQLFVESQAEYPSKAAVCFPSELLSETRSNIQKFMEAHGYAGEYPDFVKQGEIRGVHLADAYNMTYFVGAEKNVRYHIHCTETYFNEHLMIQFLCSTELLKKNENAGDIYSCLFNANGRRFFQTVSYESDYIDESGECVSQDLEQRVQIAVKKAELKKLTKEERKEILDSNIPHLLVLPLCVFAFIIFCGLAGVLMTAGFMLLGVILGLIFAGPQSIPSMFTEIPWWKFFFFAWGLFVVGMGILTMWENRK